MADALRATPHFLSELQQIARQPGSVQLLGAIEVALDHRQQHAANKAPAPDADPRLQAQAVQARLPERQWTLTEALVLLQDPARKRELFGVLQSARSIGFLIGPLVGGALFDFQAWMPYVLACVVCIFAAMLVPHIDDEPHSDSPQACVTT